MIIILGILLLAAGGVGIWWAMNIPPTPAAERVRIDSLVTVLKGTLPGTLLEDISGKIQVIDHVDTEAAWVYFCNGDQTTNGLEINRCAKELARLYAIGDSLRSQAAERFISQMVAQAK